MTRDERIKLKLAQRENDLRIVMSTASGRRIFYKLIDDCGVLSASFAPDTHQTAFREGRRDVGISLVQELQARTPSEYFQMLEEHRPVLKQIEVDDPPEERSPFQR